MIDAVPVCNVYPVRGLSMSSLVTRCARCVRLCAVVADDNREEERKSTLICLQLVTSASP